MSNLPAEFFSAVEHCLLLSDPAEKTADTASLFQLRETLKRDASATAVRRLDKAGVPARPKLVDPHKMKRRGTGSAEGRIALLHALAHIEFNAINLALDAVYRFRDMPEDYAMDWLRVAADEARHFNLLQARLNSLGSEYGAFDAHDGLWTMAVRTDHDVLVRMALVPRVLEARGLDVAPSMIERLRQSGDSESAEILNIIYHDEIEHVSIGNRWFLTVCAERDLQPTTVFADLLKQHTKGVLRGPYNAVARIQAGFTEEEMLALEQIEAEFKEQRSE